MSNAFPNAFPNAFYELRERLLRAGVAPRHVRSYLAELADRLADLTAEEERAGRSRADAEAAALSRLGTMDELASRRIEHRQLQSWSARAPWAMFGLAPLLLLAAAWLVACSILWSGWKIFLPGSATPFIRTDGFSVFYFGVGRLLYFNAPLLIGWGIGVLAARQRLRMLWPAIGMVLIALLGGTVQVHTSPPASPAGAGHVSLGFALGPSVQGIPDGLLHALVILTLEALPFVLWRLLSRPVASLRLRMQSH
ncbi:MAG TPA: hypothetical protein VM554_00695 [Acidisarcina sp.]|nr:hypothetical protein [Acidisarcina sp.]